MQSIHLHTFEVTLFMEEEEEQGEETQMLSVECWKHKLQEICQGCGGKYPRPGAQCSSGMLVSVVVLTGPCCFMTVRLS